MSLETLEALGITPPVLIAELAGGELGGFVAEEEGRIVAFAMARHSDGSLFALFTLPAHEGRGHGSRLLDRALAWLKAKGHLEATLSTGIGTKAEAFYRKRGWTGHERSESFADDIILRCKL